MRGVIWCFLTLQNNKKSILWSLSNHHITCRHTLPIKREYIYARLRWCGPIIITMDITINYIDHIHKLQIRFAAIIFFLHLKLECWKAQKGTYSYRIMSILYTLYLKYLIWDILRSNYVDIKFCGHENYDIIINNYLTKRRNKFYVLPRVYIKSKI